jgi:leader peptidase (prepilin peptidase)/N-methyltransferase
MLLYFYLLSFALGTIIGSFLNVLIYRLNSGFGIGGRSQCFSCGKTLHWYELVPLLSFLILRGRCSVCKSRISFQYPIIETLTGITFTLLLHEGSKLFGLVINPLSTLWFALCATIFSILIVIVVYDIRHKIIPDSLAILFGALSLVYFIIFKSPLLFFYTHGVSLISSTFFIPLCLSLVSGLAFFMFFFIFWFFSKGTWMGLGDAKLAVGIGWFLGWSAGIASLMISFWTGAIVGLFLIAISKLVVKISEQRKLSRLSALLRGITIKTEVPFAPFLVFALFFVFFLGIDLRALQAFITSVFYL